GRGAGGSGSVSLYAAAGVTWRTNMLAAIGPCTLPSGPTPARIGLPTSPGKFTPPAAREARPKPKVSRLSSGWYTMPTSDAGARPLSLLGRPDRKPNGPGARGFRGNFAGREAPPSDA